MIRSWIGWILAAALLEAVSAKAMTRNVPAQYASIQSAIEAAVNSDTVLVAPGTYFENINFRGKNIVVASQYILNHDVSAIANTIINGSQPANPDTGSCVLIISGEDTSAVLEGFKLTGGTGTPLQDDQNGLTYVEGGGIMIEESSPTISHNWIIGNQATRRPTGISSAGGGGIRCGFGAPRLYNNLIMNNQGRYGGGVVVNYANATLHNNIIIQNSGGQDYGGAGLWLTGANDTSWAENNTICGNTSVLAGGGIWGQSVRLLGKNFIVWGNRASQGAQQINGATTVIQLTYSDVQGGRAGLGNFDFNPLFADSNLRLMPLSPCVDSGDSTLLDPDNSRSDHGAYGGPRASTFPSFSIQDLTPASFSLAFPSGGPGVESRANLILYDFGAAASYVDSVRSAHSPEVFVESFPVRVAPFSQDTVHLLWIANSNLPLADTLLIYHHDPSLDNPSRIVITGAIGTAANPHDAAPPEEFVLHQNYPNPFNASTEIRFELPVPARVKLEIYDLLGNLVTTLLDAPRDAGVHLVSWDAAPVASGVYLYRLRAGGFQQERLMILIK